MTAGSEPIAAGRDTDDTVGRPLAAASLDELECITVGIDVGSSITDLGMSRLRLRRLKRQAVDQDGRRRPRRNPSLGHCVQPHPPDYTIDAKAIARLVRGEFAAAGLAPDDIDTGAVILTGKRSNDTTQGRSPRRPAALAGSFVAATAGAHLRGDHRGPRFGCRRPLTNARPRSGPSRSAAGPLVRRHRERTRHQDRGDFTAGGRLVTAFSAGGEITRIEPAAQVVRRSDRCRPWCLGDTGCRAAVTTCGGNG